MTPDFISQVFHKSYEKYPMEWHDAKPIRLARTFGVLIYGELIL